MGLSKLPTKIKRFLSNTAGATAIEYALILSLMTIALIGGMSTLGSKTGGSFQNTVDKWDEAVTQQQGES